MEMTESITAFAALAHPARLRAFRLLVAQGPAGLAAGTLAVDLGVPASTLSVHLAKLAQAGLVTSRRASRHIYYSVDIARVRALVGFLVDDCCQGRPELCGPARIAAAA